MKAYGLEFKVVNDQDNEIGNELRRHAENRRQIQRTECKELPIHFGQSMQFKQRSIKATGTAWRSNSRG